MSVSTFIKDFPLKQQRMVTCIFNRVTQPCLVHYENKNTYD